MRKARLLSIFFCIVLSVSLFTTPAAYAEPSVGTPADASADAAVRTILIYMCGSDLETDAALATANIAQILSSQFSEKGQVNVVIMTGGSETWWLKEADCVFPSGVLINNFDETDYNRIWEAKGANDPENAGKLILLDADGILSTPGNPSPAWAEPMSDPETLRAFINFGAENYPAEKYDLVLWNHGGGPIDGFGYDEYSLDETMMSLPGILDAISDNLVTANGGKFDFIDFDACLMNSVELNLALSDYTDCYIASAETVPGHGQDYSGWLNTLGSMPDVDAFHLGEIISDDYICFYTDEDGRETDYATLAVVNTDRLMEADFAGAIARLSAVLSEQLNTPDAYNEILYYDELDSAKRSIRYGKPDTYYKDLGNLAAMLAVTNKELSMQNLDENGSYNRLNAYADASAEILRILKNQDIIYSRYTENLVIDPQMQMDADQELVYKNLAPTGIHIYFPAIDDSDYVLDYLAAVSGSLPYIKNEDAKNALRSYANFIAQQALLVELGYTVNYMIGKMDAAADDVNLAAVKAFLDAGASEGPTNWSERIVPLMEYFAGSEEAAAAWMETVIRQEASDHIQPENISVQSDTEERSFRITLENTGKRAVENVSGKVIAELPAARAFLENDLRLSFYLYFQQDQAECCIRTQNAIQDSSDLHVDYNTDSIDTILEKTIAWYQDNKSVWNLEFADEGVYAVQDGEGNLHAAQIVALDDNRLLAYFMYTDPETRSRQYGYLVFEPEGNAYKLSKICANIKYGDRLIPADELTTEISDLTMGYEVKLKYYPFTLIPMSLTPFALTSENAGSIQLVIADPANVPDIQDTDGDGKPFHKRLIVTSIYQYDKDITDLTRTRDLVRAEELTVEDVVYNGKEQGPRVLYNGTLLEENRDYKWVKADDELSYRAPGTYRIVLIGIGSRFTGRTEITYSIVRPEPSGTSGSHATLATGTAMDSPSVPETPEALPFTDVPTDPGNWVYQAVNYVYHQGIMTGMTGTCFGAAENLSRAQFAAILYRMAGEPPVSAKQIFPDVPITEDTKWYADAVAWANENRIILGYENGFFGPADDITREQIAVILYRYANYMKYDTENKADFSNYSDAEDVSSWAAEAMQWAVGNDIICGKSETHLDPSGNATRAECAAMAARFMQKFVA